MEGELSEETIRALKSLGDDVERSF